MSQFRKVGYYADITDANVEGFQKFFETEAAALAEVKRLEINGIQDGLCGGDTIRAYYWSGKGETPVESGTRRVQGRL